MPNFFSFHPQFASARSNNEFFKEFKNNERRYVEGCEEFAKHTIAEFYKQKDQRSLRSEPEFIRDAVSLFTTTKELKLMVTSRGYDLDIGYVIIKPVDNGRYKISVQGETSPELTAKEKLDMNNTDSFDNLDRQHVHAPTSLVLSMEHHTDLQNTVTDEFLIDRYDQLPLVGSLGSGGLCDLFVKKFRATHWHPGPSWKVGYIGIPGMQFTCTSVQDAVSDKHYLDIAYYEYENTSAFQQAYDSGEAKKKAIHIHFDGDGYKYPAIQMIELLKRLGRW